MVITVISDWGDFGPNHLSPEKLWRHLGQTNAKLSCRASSKKVDIANVVEIGTRNCTSVTRVYQQYKDSMQRCIQVKQRIQKHKNQTTRGRPPEGRAVFLLQKNK